MLSTEGTRIEARRTESGGLFLGEGGSQPPPHQLEGLGEHCNLPQRGLEWSPSRNRIWCFFVLKYDIIIWRQQI